MIIELYFWFIQSIRCIYHVSIDDDDELLSGLFKKYVRRTGIIGGIINIAIIPLKVKQIEVILQQRLLSESSILFIIGIFLII
jgi:hypothetical protein